MPGRVQYHQVTQTPGLVLGEADLGGFCFKRHFHLDFHVGLVTRGMEKIGYRGTSACLERGSVSFMPAHEIHDGAGDTASGAMHTLKTFRISAELMTAMVRDISGDDQPLHLRPALIRAPQWWQQLALVHQSLAGNSSVSALATDEQLLHLVKSLLEHSQSVKPEAIDEKLGHRQWATLLDYCHAHLAQKISLEDLAGLCGLSRFQFLRRFSKTTGITPYAWLLRLRLENACRLLASGRQSIAQVAAEVGFYDQSHFNRAFKLAYKVAPSDY